MSNQETTNSDPPDGSQAMIDAVVLAGARNTLPFQNCDNKPVPKPLLQVGGMTLVSRVVEAALRAQQVGRVFVIGNRRKLERALAVQLVNYSPRLQVIEEGQDIVDNCRKAYFHHLLPQRGFEEARLIQPDNPASIQRFIKQRPDATRVPMLIITSDLPFIHAHDIEDFLSQVDQKSALITGMCDHLGLIQMQQALGSQTVLDRWKLGAFPLRKCDVRITNTWLTRPLLANPNLYAMMGEIYSHRWLFSQEGRLLYRNWWAIFRAIARYAMRSSKRLRFLRGLLNGLGVAISAAMARLLRRVSKHAAKPFRLFLSQRDLEFWTSLLIDAPSKLIIGKSIAPAIDIDVEECYQALIADGEENYRRMAKYLGQHEHPRHPDAVPDPKPDLKVIAGGKS